MTDREEQFLQMAEDVLEDYASSYSIVDKESLARYFSKKFDDLSADVAPVDELIEAVKKIICENTYPSFDHNGKPVNVWKAREGYDALDALKEKYKGV